MMATFEQNKVLKEQYYRKMLEDDKVIVNDLTLDNGDVLVVWMNHPLDDFHTRIISPEGKVFTIGRGEEIKSEVFNS